MPGRLENLINKIHKEWRGLFTTLCSEGTQINKVEEWLQTKMIDNKLSWELLLHDLSHMEPIVTKKQLLLEPLFVHLPIDAQRQLLTIFCCHRSTIDKKALQDFLHHLHDIIKPDWDQRTYRLYTMLLDGYEDSPSNKPVFNLYKFLPSNNDLYHSVMKNLSTERQTPWQNPQSMITDVSSLTKNIVTEDSPDLFAEVDMETDCAHNVSEMNNIKECVSSPNPVQLNLQPKCEISPSHERPQGQMFDAVQLHNLHKNINSNNVQCPSIQVQENLNPKNPISNQFESEQACNDNTESIIISSDEEQKEDKGEGQRKRKASNEAVNKVKPKRHKESHKNDPVEATDITTYDKIMLDKLKERWLQGEVTSSIELDILISSSLSKIKFYCIYLELWNLDEKQLILVYDDLISKAHVMLTEKLLIILQYSLQYELKELSQSPSRELTSAVTKLSSLFPQLMIKFFIQSFNQLQLNNVQTEVMCRNCIDHLKPTDLQYCVRCLVESVTNFTEPAISVLQSLIDKKVEIPSEVTSKLIGCLLRSCDSLTNSKKFGKFMLHFVNKYGKKLSVADLSNLQVIIDTHQSFLKKTILMAFKTINK